MPPCGCAERGRLHAVCMRGLGKVETLEITCISCLLVLLGVRARCWVQTHVIDGQFEPAQSVCHSVGSVGWRGLGIGRGVTRSRGGLMRSHARGALLVLPGIQEGSLGHVGQAGGPCALAHAVYRSADSVQEVAFRMLVPAAAARGVKHAGVELPTSGQASLELYLMHAWASACCQTYGFVPVAGYVRPLVQRQLQTHGSVVTPLHGRSAAQVCAPAQLRPWHVQACMVHVPKQHARVTPAHQS